MRDCDGILAALKKTLEIHKNEYVAYLQDIVSIDTQDIGHGIKGGREKEGQEYLIKLFEEMCADNITKDDMSEEFISEAIAKHREGNPGHDYTDRFNIYATFKSVLSNPDNASDFEHSPKTILFNGHIDTMPPGDLSLWESPPHKPEIRDGLLYGLGSCDMKGGLMAAIMAVKLISDAKLKLPAHVIITSVCDEEGGGNGSIRAIMQGLKADGVVVCEPTSRELILAHMGFVFFKVSIEGRSNHSGAKWLGVSAIEKMTALMQRLNDLEHRWLLKYKHPLLPAPNLNVGTIHGGSAGSTVAGECAIEICVHYLPRLMSHEQVVSEITDEIERFSRSDLWLKEHPPKVEIYQSGGAFEMPEDEFTKSFCDAYKKVRGEDVKIAGSPAGCDARLWRNIAECPTIQYGPGNLEQCHSVNEYLSVDEYLQTILIYAMLILEFNNP
ncbi:MAG: ArgE/DapE family deacylase [Lachnospiraceae bacterium]|jgi:acetylornithine deacetylase|nr:ArgE/DapE family deacylase [Lachnospiraceae bacterium]